MGRELTDTISARALPKINYKRQQDNLSTNGALGSKNTETKSIHELKFNYLNREVMSNI